MGVTSENTFIMMLQLTVFVFVNLRSVGHIASNKKNVQL